MDDHRLPELQGAFRSSRDFPVHSRIKCCQKNAGLESGLLEPRTCSVRSIWIRREELSSGPRAPMQPVDILINENTQTTTPRPSIESPSVGLEGHTGSRYQAQSAGSALAHSHEYRVTRCRVSRRSSNDVPKDIAFDAPARTRSLTRRGDGVLYLGRLAARAPRELAATERQRRGGPLGHLVGSRRRSALFDRDAPPTRELFAYRTLCSRDGDRLRSRLCVG
jgi:hypothetical protein